MPAPPSVVRARRGEGLVVGAIGGLCAGVGVALCAWSYVSPYRSESPIAHLRWWLTATPAARAWLIDRLAAAHALIPYFAAPIAGVAAATVVGTTLYKMAARARDDLIHVTGRALSDRVSDAIAEAKARGAKASDIRLGRIPFARRHLSLSVYNLGGPGAGKTEGVIKPLLSAVLADGSTRCLVIDTKGEFTSEVAVQAGRRLALLAPWDARSTTWWIAKDLRDVIQVQRFAESLVPESSDPMWSSAARSILVALIEKLRAEHGEKWGWRSLASLCSAQFDVVKAAVDAYYPQGARIVEQATKTSQGVMITLSAHLAPIFALARAEPEARGKICLRDWVHGIGDDTHKQLGVLIAQNSGAYQALGRPVLKAVFEHLAALIASPDWPATAKPLAIFIDELAQLPPLSGLLPLLEVGRGRGVFLVLSTQDHAQMEALYKERARIIPGACGTAIYMQCSAESARAVSEMLGRRQVERPTVHAAAPGSRGAGISYTADAPHIVSQGVIEQLELVRKRRSLAAEAILAVRGWRRIYKIQLPFSVHWKKLRPAHIPALWLSAPATPSDTSTPPVTDTATATPPASDPPPAADAASPLPDDWPAVGAQAEVEEVVQEVETPAPPQSVDDVPAGWPAASAEAEAGEQQQPEAEAGGELGDKVGAEVAAHAIDAIAPGVGAAIEAVSEIADAVADATPSAPPAAVAPAQAQTAEEKRRRFRARLRQRAVEQEVSS